MLLCNGTGSFDRGKAFKCYFLCTYVDDLCYELSVKYPTVSRNEEGYKNTNVPPTPKTNESTLIIYSPFNLS